MRSCLSAWVILGLVGLGLSGAGGCSGGRLPRGGVGGGSGDVTWSGHGDPGSFPGARSADEALPGAPVLRDASPRAAEERLGGDEHGSRRISAPLGWSAGGVIRLIAPSLPHEESRVLFALPGPLILLPLAVGVVQFLLALFSMLLPLARQPGLGRLLLALLGLAALGYALGRANSAILLTVGALAWRRPQRWAPVLLVLIVVSTAISSATYRFEPLLPLPLGNAIEGAPPNDAAALPALRRGGAVILHVGEQEEFSNCHLPGGYYVRPADLAEHRDRLRDMAQTRPVIALVTGRHLDAVTRELRPLGIKIYPANDLLPGGSAGVMCYDPPAPFSFAITRWLAHSRGVPDVPGADFDGTPRLRPADVLASHAHLVMAREILAKPTSDIRATEAPIILLGDTVAAVGAALRLWRNAGGVVSGTAPKATAVVSPYRRASPQAALVEVALVGVAALIVERRLCRLQERRVRAFLTGRGARPRWLLPPELATFTFGVLAAWSADQAVLPVRWGLLVTPAIWGGPAWLGPVLLCAVAALLWVRLRRYPWMLFGASVLTIAAAHALVVGPAPMPLHLLAFLAVGVAPLIAGMWVRSGGHLVELAQADRVAWAGGKARRLAPAVRRGLPVPPGIVLRPTPRAAREATSRFPGDRLLLRSSAPDEDDHPDSAGRYLTLGWAPEDGIAVLQRRIEEVAATCHGAVLVMPRVAAEAAGVVTTEIAGGRVALVEEAAGNDAVTAGSTQVIRHWVGLKSGAIRSEGNGIAMPYAKQIIDAVNACGCGSGEWLLRGDTWLLVQLRPGGDAIPPPSVPDGAGAAITQLAMGDHLERVDADTLSDPARQGSLALWTRRWRRDDALGDAYALLGLPRWLAPRQAVVPLGGRMYASGAAMRRIQLVPILPGSVKRAARAITRFSRQAERRDPEDELRRLAALSIALRIVQPVLPRQVRLPANHAHLLPTQRYVADLAAGHIELWGHRAHFDLDPASPRYGVINSAPPPLPVPPASPTEADAELWRDLLLDRMAREISRLARSQTDWGPLPIVPAMHERYSIANLEGCAPAAPDGRTGAACGVWVSGGGPIEARISSTPRAGTIWAIAQATPNHAGRWTGCAAILCARGGLLSHLAMVARAEGMPALFGVTDIPAEGSLVRIEANGRISILGA